MHHHQCTDANAPTPMHQHQCINTNAPIPSSPTPMHRYQVLSRRRRMLMDMVDGFELEVRDGNTNVPLAVRDGNTNVPTSFYQ